MFAPSLLDGKYSCEQDSDCPSGMQCATELRLCFKKGEIPDGGNDRPCSKEGDTRACYTGPLGTSGIGVCRPGTEVCQNSQWSECQGQVVPQEEQCNGQDDNCNGQIDENCPCADGDTRSCYPGPAGTVDVGNCRIGQQTCSKGKWGNCLNAITPQPETCNGQDDDCNGLVDDMPPRSCYTGPPPTLGIGICKSGSQTCENGKWGECLGQILPKQSEICGNGLDDNCNGQIDEGCACKPGEIQVCYNGPPRTQGIGECKSGTQKCSNVGLWEPCQGQVLPSTEICDDKDNDCNGQIDDQIPPRTCYTGPPNTPGVGICRAGIQNCILGSWGHCIGEITPKSEICDGLDNNCNGTVDEGCGCVIGESRPCYSGPPGTDGKGICKAGTQTCSQTQQWGPCVGEVTPQPETCDGLDNDCDGYVDSFSRRCYSGPPSTEGKGICRAGAQTCTNGKWSVCLGETLPAEEKCDGVDNNCNGTIDGITRECYSAKTGCDLDQHGKYTCIGTCKPGKQTCTNGLWGSCEGEITPQPEICNGKDDDCDGKIDDFTEECYTGSDKGCTPDGKGGFTCKGICKIGTRICNNGQYTICAGQITGQPEICDGKDNNCNGQIDEGCQCQEGDIQLCYTGPTNTQGVGPCKSGTQKCTSHGVWGTCVGEITPTTEICDGIDNDCDGTIDEIKRHCFTGSSGCTRNLDGTFSCAGQCKSGIQTCTNGKWSECSGEVTPKTETCNGIDDDCNGKIDDNLTPPPCEKQLGVCKGSVKRCAGSQGWLDCSASDYGPDYQLIEDKCDGKDNDCDGVTDGERACSKCLFSEQPATFTSNLPPSCTPTTPCFAQCLWYQGQLYYCRNTDNKGYLYTTYNSWFSACNNQTTCIQSHCANNSYFCDGSAWRLGSPPGTNDDFCDGLDNNCNGKTDEDCGCGSICTADIYCKSPCPRCIKQSDSSLPKCSQ